ncbi:MAG: CopD family protein [Alphaproteobacteria bacterium]|nr:CopD family protein [Alphaproteobacteria bacterium]
MLYDYYFTLKALHILAVIAWMAGLLYLPRLFIYHKEFDVKSKAYEIFCLMEKRLLKIIMLPSLLMSFLFGILLAFVTKAWSMPWFHVKFLLLLLLAAFHGYLSTIAKTFAQGKYPAISDKALRFLNELPFLLAIFIVFLAVFKPSFH